MNLVSFIINQYYANRAKRKTAKGAFGNKINKSIGDYKTLKVIPKSERTKDNCNNHGIMKG